VPESIAARRQTLLRSVPHTYAVERDANGALHTAFSEEGTARRDTLVDETGRLTAAQPSPGSEALEGLHFLGATLTPASVDIKLSHVLHGESARTPGALVAYNLVLTTPTTNVRQVRETITRPRWLGWMGLASGVVIGAGGGAIIAVDDTTSSFRYGVGVPLAAVGTVAAAFFLYVLALPAHESHTIPLGSLPSP
jgi:hypothetical protein